MSIRVGLLGILLLLIPLVISAENPPYPQPLTPYLVHQINPETKWSYPYGLTVIDGITYFSANDGIHGSELWRSDGTADGTYLLKVLNQSGGSSPTQFTRFADKIFFTAIGSDAKRTLWTSDGTADGTQPFVNIYPAGSEVMRNLTVVGDTLFFFANSADGRGLWKSDGTIAGTQLVEITEPVNNYPRSNFLAAINDHLIFVKSSDDYKMLYSSDGNGPIETIAKFDALSPAFVEHDDALYFSVQDANDRWSFWRTDGTTSGTQQAALAFFGFERQQPFRLTAHQGALYFHSYHPLGSQLYRLNGTSIMEIPNGVFDHIDNLVSADDILYVSIRDGDVRKLVGLDGSGFVEFSGTNAFSDIMWMKVSAEMLYFSAVDQDNDEELWQLHDGQISQVADLNQATSSRPGYPAATADGIMFSAVDELHGREMWIADSSGARLAKDINTISWSSSPERIIKFQDAAHFIAKSGSHYGIWKSDGTEDGTVGVTTESRFGRLRNLTQIGDHLYFTHDEQLWRTTGEPNGEALLHTFGSAPSWLRVVGNTLFLVARNDAYQETLWKFDGDSLTEVIVTTTNPFADGPIYLYAVGDLLFFCAFEDSGSSRGLWRTDGTEQGTFSLSQLTNNADGPADPRDMRAINGELYFSADNYAGRELWKTDGTVAGTRLVKNISAEIIVDENVVVASSSEPRSMTEYRGKVYFSAKGDDTGREIWVTDGTEEGTTLFLDLQFGGGASYPESFTVHNDRLYFVGDDGVHGRQIVETDGTLRNTRFVAQADWHNFSPSRLTSIGDWLYFMGDDGEFGKELWQTNGEVTQRLTNINPVGDSEIFWLTAINERLFFQAEDADGDKELYALFVPDLLPSQLFLPHLATHD